MERIFEAMLPTNATRSSEKLTGPELNRVSIRNTEFDGAFASKKTRFSMRVFPPVRFMKRVLPSELRRSSVSNGFSEVMETQPAFHPC